MSVYTTDPAISSGNLVQSEVHLYGSSRLGIFEIMRNVQTLVTADYLNNLNTFTRGNKIFELNNHLGNVLVTVSDKKIAVDSDNDGLVNYYNADVVTATDYYPFGMTMPGRKYSQPNSSYRYGFNGQEKSDDVTAGNYTAEYWEYDSRIGRRWNVDPVSVASESPYSTNNNNPIVNSDPDGDFPGLGFLVGMITEVIIQTIEIKLGVRKDYDVYAIVISGVATQLGMGVAKQISRIKTLGTFTKAALQVGKDVAINLGEQSAKHFMTQKQLLVLLML